MLHVLLALVARASTQNPNVDAHNAFGNIPSRKKCFTGHENNFT